MSLTTSPLVDDGHWTVKLLTQPRRPPWPSPWNVDPRDLLTFPSPDVHKQPISSSTYHGSPLPASYPTTDRFKTRAIGQVVTSSKNGLMLILVAAFNRIWTNFWNICVEIGLFREYFFQCFQPFVCSCVCVCVESGMQRSRFLVWWLTTITPLAVAISIH